jgi:hypothetical protein
MSGMKINYNKSEAFAIGVDAEEQRRIAYVFNCRVGELPINYLGLPISDHKASRNQLAFVEWKVANRLSSWKCDNLSSGGKSVLIQSCLSSVLLYTMGAYIFYEGNFQHQDMLTSRFFWQGMRKKRNYHMIRWEALSRYLRKLEGWISWM